MLTHEAIIEKYHSYFFSVVLEGGDPEPFQSWYDSYMLPYLTGIELIVRNTN